MLSLSMYGNRKMIEKELAEISRLNSLPEGWKFVKGAMTAPVGYKWACNGKSRFKPGYEHALVKEEQWKN